MYSSGVSERGGKALANPPGASMLTVEEGWRPNPRTVFVAEDEKAKARTFAGNENCYVRGARLAGDDIYALRTCIEAGMSEELVRLDAAGKTVKLAMPTLVKGEAGFKIAKTDAEKKKAIACAPKEIVVRGKDDVWAWALCGGGEVWRPEGAVPIVLRRGRPQEPIVLP
jgi:hypothetical protein